jgi:hypothetical protein
MMKTIWRSSTNISHADLIETRFLMPLATCRPQGKLRRGFGCNFCQLPAAPLPPLLFATAGLWPVRCGKEKREGRVAVEVKMKREEIEALRARVRCEVLLESDGWNIDIKESTRRAVKYRRGGGIVIVTHDGHGWFDPLGNGKGDVFGLAMFLDGLSFSSAVEEVASLVGFRLSRPLWRPVHAAGPAPCLEERWQNRRVPGPGSQAWRYLCWTRSIPVGIVREVVRCGTLREGPFGSMWAAHVDDDGRVVGWEERGPDWRGFANGGSKILFRLGGGDYSRLCVTEAAIDAMSLAAIEDLREGTLYLSTGGGWSPATDNALAVLAGRPGTQLVAATDANSQGEVYADRLRSIAEKAGCDWHRLTPPADDWNEALQNQAREMKERRKSGTSEACRMRAARVKGGFARPGPALDPPGTKPAQREGS